MSRAEIFLKHLVQTGLRSQWYDESQDSNDTVWAAMRTARIGDSGVDGQQIMSLPMALPGHMSRLFDLPQCQFIVCLNHQGVSKLISQLMPYQTSLVVDSDTMILIRNGVDDLTTEDLATTDSFLLHDENRLLIWARQAGRICELVNLRQRQLLALLHDSSYRTCAISQSDKGAEKLTGVEVVDEMITAEAALPSDERPVRWIWPAVVATTFCLIGGSWGVVLGALLPVIMSDASPGHALYILYLPFSGFLSSFFVSVIVLGCFQVLGPISHLRQNSRTYSGRQSGVRMHTADLPHVTIQCPVYREDLHEVLAPTFESLFRAIETYKSQGGSASIIVYDDGLQIMSEELRKARICYYDQHDIAYVARPGHLHEGFVREGAFKKASNLNFGMRISHAIREEMSRREDDAVDTDALYGEAVKSVVNSQSFVTVLDGDLRLGPIVLLIDADTRVPEDCFLGAVSEFFESADLAILQHASGVLQVMHNYWENALAHFTRSNYFGTRYIVAAGDATPFFGHNAFLRLEALEKVAFDGNDGQKRWWSESHVSEDFEMALKLQSEGYVLRMAGYSDGGFQEGVCLSVYDEISRWEKYAYGVSELIFKPVRFWFTRGPFTPLFWNFVRSNTELGSKCSSLFYMGTYFGLGYAWPFALLNYILIGMSPQPMGKFFVSALQVLIAVTVIFGLKDAFVGTLVQYRMGEARLSQGLWRSLKSLCITTLFFQGLSLHVSACLIRHLIGRKMSWGATNKSAASSTIADDLRLVAQRYGIIYGVNVGMLLVVVAMATIVPVNWRITDFTAVVPFVWQILSHLLMPLILNNRSILNELR